jgi:uncharacterized membrane protein YfcA
VPDPAWTYLALAVSAFAAGVMNSVAGGGTLLTFPALMTALGPDGAAVANATSTLALLPGSAAGTWGYRAELGRAWPFALRMLGPSLVGGFLGAWLVGQDQKRFAALVPWLILTAAVLFLLQQPLSAWLRKHRPDHKPGAAGTLGLMGFQFLVAVYGGYFGAGIGILMLTALGLMGIDDIHRMNGVKTFLATAINGASVVIFLADGLIHWRYAAAMMLAAVVGGYAGARVARRLPAAAVRWSVVAIGFGLSAYYFWQRSTTPG